MYTLDQVFYIIDTHKWKSIDDGHIILVKNPVTNELIGTFIKKDNGIFTKSAYDFKFTTNS